MPTSTGGCIIKLKIGEAARPNSMTDQSLLEPGGPPIPRPPDYEAAWTLKSKAPAHVWKTPGTAVDDANATAAAWMAHPANKMQLPSLQKMHDADGDGLTNKEEFKALLQAAGSFADAAILFDQMDADGDGVLTEAEIKALGQDRDGRAGNRGGL